MQTTPTRTPDAADDLATTDVLTASPDATVAQVIEALVGNRFESLHDIAVVREGLLMGLLPLEELTAASPGALIGDLMDPNPPAVAPGVDREAAAWKAVEHGESSVAVVDEEGRFRGLIPPVRLLRVLLEEHEEDMARLGGFRAGTERALRASVEPVTRRYLHRLPWLLIGLAGALLSALIVGGFEQRLRENLVLAAFLPGIVYLADAVGTQTEALIVRGLSVGAPILPTLRREAVTGVLVGVTLAAVFLPIGAWWLGSADVVLVVAIAMLSACSVATVVALGLPMILNRLGVDPAFGAGPLATVLQDLLSIAIYFGTAMAVLG